MKKLLFIAIFSLGLFTISNAQWMTYSLTNSGSDTWDFGMTNPVAGTTTYELNITPAQNRTGIVPFGFPLEFKAGNNNGCGTYQLVPAVTNGVFVPINNCNTPTSLKYRLELVIPFVLWEFELKFG